MGPAAQRRPTIAVAVVALALAARLATPLSYVPTAGGALRFNGAPKHRTFVAIAPQCQADGNPFAAPSVTLATWFRTATASSVEQMMVGYAFAQGPMLGLQRDGNAMYKPDPVVDASKCRNVPLANLIDGSWHHLALAVDQTHIHLYVDGVAVIQCNATLPPMDVAARFHLGCFDDALDSANAQSFSGDLDDVRVYKRALLTEADVRATMSGPPSPADLADLLVWMPFDGGTVANKAPLSTSVDLGGGTIQRSPVLVASSAPIRSAAGELVVEARQDATASVAPALAMPLLVAVPIGGALATNATATIAIAGVRVSSGALAINGAPVVAGATLGPFVAPVLSFAQALGRTGPSQASFNATFTIVDDDGITTTVQDVRVVVDVRDNSRPIAGSAGNAASFDGVNDFYMAERLAWPTKPVPAGAPPGAAVPARGLSAITIEFWAWVDATSAGNTAVFALGGNGEQLAEWVPWFNARRLSGRWHAVLPSPTNELLWNFGNDALSVPAGRYYKGWAHYAFRHDGVEGTTASVLVNGVQVAGAVHDHDGMQAGQLDFNHVTIGTWTFWSDVYHRGVVDDFRMWNRSRTDADIQRDMWRQLRGDEPDLYAYWTFDSDAGGVVRDATGRGNDLVAGGCVSCAPRFYCQPYSQTPLELNDASCVPTATSVDSPYYRGGMCYGGTICFKGEERADTHPAIVLSGAPIGGFVFNPVGQGGDVIAITLNATDRDGDALVFSIVVAPTAGVLQYQATPAASWAPIGQTPFLLPAGVASVRLVTNALDGGRPFATLSYAAADDMVMSLPIAVAVDLTCPPGTYLDQGALHCAQCPPGTFSNMDGFATSCTPCPVNQFQGEARQTTCLKCIPGESYAPVVGSRACTPCSMSTAGEIARVWPVSSSQCAVGVHVDNAVADSGDAHSVIDFSFLLPDAVAAGEARAVLSTLPQFGKMHQLNADGTLGEGFYDYFFSPVRIQEQFVAAVVHASHALDDRPASEIVGAPDVAISGSSPKAWAPFAGDSGVATITLHYAEALFVTGVVISENVGGGAVTQIEAQVAAGANWTTIWAGTPLPAGLTAARSFRPNICPTNFRTDALRLTIDAMKCSGRNEIDAVAMLGARHLKESRKLLVERADMQVAYVPARLADTSRGYQYTDSVSYEVRDCRAGDVLFDGVYTMRVTLGDAAVVHQGASRGIVVASVAIALFGIGVCLASVLALHYHRAQPIIRASSVFFMNVLLIGLVAGFTCLLITAINAGDHRAIPNFCAIRPFVFSLAFVLVLGSIVVKTARIVWIFEISVGTVVKLTNQKLSLFLAAMLAVEMANNALWAVLDPLTDTTMVVGAASFQTCESGGAGVFGGVSIAFKVVLVVAGLGFAVKARNVPSAFNEVKAMSFVSYCIASQAGIYVVLSGLLRNNPDALLIVTAFATVTALLSTWAMLVVYKLFIVVFRPEMNTVSTKTAVVAPHRPETHTSGRLMTSAGQR